ncbi:hypothetical protein GOODEAATRI_000263 [Goodea atripinnis]|uniref:Uncharacterized protein n=1 Tax=Goodea atripinnis TaxID=208336 RepID=A0ABV0MR37_9TELE
MTFPGLTALPVRYKLTSFLGAELQDVLPVEDAEEYPELPLKHRSVSNNPEVVKPELNLRQHIQDPAMMFPDPPPLSSFNSKALGKLHIQGY